VCVVLKRPRGLTRLQRLRWDAPVHIHYLRFGSAHFLPVPGLPRGWITDTRVIGRTRATPADRAARRFGFPFARVYTRAVRTTPTMVLVPGVRSWPAYAIHAPHRTHGSAAFLQLAFMHHFRVLPSHVCCLPFPLPSLRFFQFLVPLSNTAGSWFWLAPHPLLCVRVPWFPHGLLHFTAPHPVRSALPAWTTFHLPDPAAGCTGGWFTLRGFAFSPVLITVVLAQQFNIRTRLHCFITV